jgi:hypothetical protein
MKMSNLPWNFSVYCNDPFSFYLYKLQVTTIELWRKGNGKKVWCYCEQLGGTQ